MIDQIAPVGGQIVGGWLTPVGARPARGERFGGRFGDGETLEGELGIDSTNLVVHLHTIANEEAVRGIRSPERLEL